MFEKTSRYSKSKTYKVRDWRGREVTVVEPAGAPEQRFLGIHRRLQGQRIDHLAYKYLRTPTQFWRICELNNVMLAEALSEADEINIPVK